MGLNTRLEKHFLTLAVRLRVNQLHLISLSRSLASACTHTHTHTHTHTRTPTHTHTHTRIFYPQSPFSALTNSHFLYRPFLSLPSLSFSLAFSLHLILLSSQALFLLAISLSYSPSISFNQLLSLPSCHSPTIFFSLKIYEKVWDCTSLSHSLSLSLFLSLPNVFLHLSLHIPLPFTINAHFLQAQDFLEGIFVQFCQSSDFFLVFLQRLTLTATNKLVQMLLAAVRKLTCTIMKGCQEED